MERDLGESAGRVGGAKGGVEAQRLATWKKENREEPFEANEVLLDDLVSVCVKVGYFQVWRTRE